MLLFLFSTLIKIGSGHLLLKRLKDCFLGYHH
ncbi:sortase B protein-sorting domain-containing protein [Bacillus sp. FJAT-49736]|nr:sortase B protein-sorting domain-containing protein [Bacillus sp. FJAT-49736]